MLGLRSTVGLACLAAKLAVYCALASGSHGIGVLIVDDDNQWL